MSRGLAGCLRVALPVTWLMLCLLFVIGVAINHHFDTGVEFLGLGDYDAPDTTASFDEAVDIYKAFAVALATTPRHDIDVFTGNDNSTRPFVTTRGNGQCQFVAFVDDTLTAEPIKFASDFMACELVVFTKEVTLDSTDILQLPLTPEAENIPQTVHGATSKLAADDARIVVVECQGCERRLARDLLNDTTGFLASLSQLLIKVDMSTGSMKSKGDFVELAQLFKLLAESQFVPLSMDQTDCSYEECSHYLDKTILRCHEGTTCWQVLFARPRYQRNE